MKMQNKTVRVRIPATTANCGPGFDTLGIACSLYNEIQLECPAQQKGIDIQVLGDGAATLPVNSRNLVLRSVQRVFEKAGVELPGIKLKLTNSIPLSRGLGSSSAAIVGGLVAANSLLGSRFSPEEMLSLATEMEGHPDNVAPALYGGFTISVMQDAQVTCLRLPLPPQLKLVVCIPEFRLSTHKARQAIPAMISHKDAVFNVSRAALLVGALTSGNLAFLAQALDDRLHQPYRASLIPGMQEVFDAGKAAGALGVAISGAGPSLMAYTMENGPQIGKAMTEVFERHQISARYLCLDIDYNGAQVVELA